MSCETPNFHNNTTFISTDELAGGPRSAGVTCVGLFLGARGPQLGFD